MEYEDFKRFNKEIFEHYGISEIASLKTGQQNPRYCVQIKGHRARRITKQTQYAGPTSEMAARKEKLPIIPEEIRKIAIGFIRRSENTKSIKYGDRNHVGDIYGVEGLSGTEWVAYRSIRLTTEQWADLVEQWNAQKKIEFLMSLVEEE